MGMSVVECVLEEREREEREREEKKNRRREKPHYVITAGGLPLFPVSAGPSDMTSLHLCLRYATVCYIGALRLFEYVANTRIR